MTEVTLFVAQTPSSKPEFLAKTKLVDSNNEILPSRIILNTYTRDAWAVGPIDKNKWSTITLQSTDGKGKISGFLKYLKERKKAMFGKLASPSSPTTKAIFVVPFENQPKPNENIIVLKYVLDTNTLKEPPKQQQQRQRTSTSSAASTSSSGATSNKKNGFLGNILGAQRRTDVCLSVVPTSKKDIEATTLTEDENSNDENNITINTTPQEVIVQFREKTESVLEDFLNSSQTTIKFPIVLSALTKHLSEDSKQSVTEDVLKYIVFEQVEEIGEDKWISIKEPSDFLDECIIAIYKEGCAPPEVFDEFNKGEIPDEIQNQERAKLVAQNKVTAKTMQKQMLEQQKKQLLASAAKKETSVEDGVALNAKKRDRRTIEEIQRDKLMDGDDSGDVKRGRSN